MNIVDNFTEIEKANAYISQINEAFKKEADEKKAETNRANNLQKSLDAETKANKTAELTTKLDAANTTINTLKSDAAAQGVEGLKSELAQANEMITELGAQLSAQANITQSDKRIVTIRKKNHYLNGTDFIIPGVGPMTADQLAQREDLLIDLLDKESSIITPVTN